MKRIKGASRFKFYAPGSPEVDCARFMKTMLELRPPLAPAWFCLRSQLRHEAMAAARLRQEGIETFLPRVRYKRSSVRGPVWVTEALFPNYLFARFDWASSQRLVRHAPGISTIVSFGPHIPTVPAEVIAALRLTIGQEELHVIPDHLAPGAAVQISGGLLHGLSAVVSQVMPSKERVRVLLDFLGRQTLVEVQSSALVGEIQARRQILQS